ncbi:MAG: hypothetical protein KFF72_01330 [Arthrospira sp. SH-MAG29]|nr:hypothetical protein [Arthrospira sp. SH-MAG29]MBS0015007.1 hypothetical protein [Arthrospira sp. SH-MAG29]
MRLSYLSRLCLEAIATFYSDYSDYSDPLLPSAIALGDNWAQTPYNQGFSRL